MNKSDKATANFSFTASASAPHRVLGGQVPRRVHLLKIPRKSATLSTKTGISVEMCWMFISYVSIFLGAQGFFNDWSCTGQVAWWENLQQILWANHVWKGITVQSCPINDSSNVSCRSWHSPHSVARARPFDMWSSNWFNRHEETACTSHHCLQIPQSMWCLKLGTPWEQKKCVSSYCTATNGYKWTFHDISGFGVGAGHCCWKLRFATSLNPTVEFRESASLMSFQNATEILKHRS